MKKITTKQATTRRYAYYWGWLVPNIVTPLVLTEMTFGIIKGTATTQTQFTLMGLIVGLGVAIGTVVQLKKMGKLSTSAAVQVATSSVGMPITLWVLFIVFYNLQAHIPNLLTILGGTAATQTATLILMVKHVKYRDMMLDWKKNHKSQDLIEV